MEHAWTKTEKTSLLLFDFKAWNTTCLYLATSSRTYPFYPCSAADRISELARHGTSYSMGEDINDYKVRREYKVCLKFSFFGNVV